MLKNKNSNSVYLQKITQVSKEAEEKLEMKAEKGRLIYPKQVKKRARCQDNL